MKQDDQILLRESTLYARHSDYASMIGHIDTYSKLSSLPIRLVAFAANADISKFFSDRTSPDYEVAVNYSRPGVWVGRLKRTYGKTTAYSVDGRFLLFKHDRHDVHLLLSDDSTAFFQEGLLRYLKTMRPRPTVPFFYSWEIETMLTRLARNKPECRIMLTRVSRKSRLMTEASRKQKETELTWTDLPYKDVFRDARQSDSWVEKVYFDLLPQTEAAVSSRTRKVLSGSIARNGVFRFELGFREFYETVIEQGIDTFVKRTAQLSNRERMKETRFAAKPLFIEFDSPVFRDKEQNKKLIQAIKTLPYSARSAIHDNPYLHLTIIDYLDNSNYDVWVLSDSRISIVPQTVCTTNSLNRFCDHVSREFQEGIIRDSEEVDQSLWE